MEQQLIKHTALIMSRIPTPGLLVLCGDSARENLITIGWLQLGWLWQLPVVNIFIRPSRYSSQLLNRNNSFSINILADHYADAIQFCGSKSGSYCDKFKETGLTKIKSKKINVSSVKQACLVLECQIIYRHSISQTDLSDIIQAKYYSEEDYHQMMTARLLHIRET